MPTLGTDIEPLFQVKQLHGCHIQTIKNVGGLLSLGEHLATFKALLQQGHHQGDGYKGIYITGTVVSIADHSGYDYPGTTKILKELGFIELGVQQGAHGDYKMHLWGHGFTLPKGESK